MLGTDDKAESAILALRPGYHRIATPVWTPGDTAEGWLFAAQGAAGIGVLGWVVYRLRTRREEKPADGPKVRRHIHLHPHLSDVAFTNRWRHRNPWEKVLFGAGFLVVAMLVPPSWCLLIALIVSMAAIAGAQIPPRSWIAVLSIPVSFAVLTAMGILLQFDASRSHFAVSIAWSGLPTAIGLLVRSFAAICCLAFIGWTTPLMELIPIGARAGVPTVLVDLALMIYRFLFIMTTTLNEMLRAQSWRLGRADYKSRMRAVSMLAGSLFIRCIHRVRRLEDGMEARGYDGHLWVLAPEHAASPLVVGGTLALQFTVLFAGLWVAKGKI
jgi:cobalt/nickel transport system permease protein